MHWGTPVFFCFFPMITLFVLDPFGHSRRNFWLKRQNGIEYSKENKKHICAK